MFKLFTWPAHSLKFVGEKIKEEVDKEMYDLDTIKQRMITIRLEYEEGTLSQEDFTEEQARLAERYRVAKEEELGQLREAIQQDQTERSRTRTRRKGRGARR
ncbi:gas vesicle protein GvpG [Salsuginibacillus kocurii]|uniref:gas vesicle protein GvpG n=1 Tax=Salsuginibacillus kocurii TaxID=427078 RepID=UPI0003698EF0|nr:gas vesicle protein GvpG [Salsuginibacillus kocurii]